MSHDPASLWQSCLAVLKKDLHSQSYQTWIEPLTIQHFDPNQVILVAPDAFFCDWVDEHYLPSLESTVYEVTSWRPEFSFQPRSAHHPTEQPDPVKPLPQARAVSSFALNPRYRFDNFIVGDSNEFAFSAARAVAEAPGKTSFNPLVIYSGVGLGKTHLLQAIGDYCLRNGTAQNVVYVTAEKFISDYITSIRKRDTAQFVSTYRSADLLLVDDIQFFLLTEGSQREFFHTFNVLFQNDKQIVLSADCAPPSLKGFEPRLISRFQCGLVASIDSPDLETRIAIVNHKAELQGVELSQDVAIHIAEAHATNVRELEGALTRVTALAKLTHRPITTDLVSQMLPSLKAQSKEIQLTEVVESCSAHYGITRVEIIGSSRKKEIANARHVSMYLAKTMTSASLKRIGVEFGGRDHSTVIHACKKVEVLIQSHPEFASEIERLRHRVETSSTRAA
ncbi:MAG TPA: chromosomal replication initiator protein DnaA [Candidatus Latescibacteria bacterium]|nr:chromosomal replication initiator protein DnaA [Candidatus Latescibacterota bacterium]